MNIEVDHYDLNEAIAEGVATAVRETTERINIDYAWDKMVGTVAGAVHTAVAGTPMRAPGEMTWDVADDDVEIDIYLRNDEVVQDARLLRYDQATVTVAVEGGQRVYPWSTVVYLDVI